MYAYSYNNSSQYRYMMAYNLTLPLISGFLCILLLTLTQCGMVLLKPIAWDGGLILGEGV